MSGISFGGLASGLDTNSIITQLMSVERNPQVRITQRQSVENVRQQALKDVQTRLNNLSTSIGSLRDAGTWGDTQDVGSSDANKVDVTRTSGAAGGAYQVTVSQLARANQFSLASGGPSVTADDTLHITTGTGGTAKTTDVNVFAGDSLDQVATRINATSATPVYASVMNGKLVLSNKVTGQDKAVSGVTTNGGSGFGFAETQTALNSNLQIDGVTYIRQSNIVSDALAGLTVTLKAQVPVGSPVTLTVGSPGADTDAIKTKIQSFVDQYNSTVDFIRGKLTEAKVAVPKTDSDRTKGVLNGDPALSGLLSGLRQQFSSVVTGRPVGSPTTLAEVGLGTGVTTGSGTLSQDAIAGKISLDSTKLTDQLNLRFDDVKALFTNVDTDVTKKGLAQRLDDSLNPWVHGNGDQPAIMDTRIASEQSVLDDLKDQYSAMDLRLTAKETALRAKFTSMETALSKVQSQGQWLSGQLAKL